jgi:hypothetical protein
MTADSSIIGPAFVVAFIVALFVQTGCKLLGKFHGGPACWSGLHCGGEKER